MPSRRTLLAAVAASSTALAGCGGLTGEASSDDGDVRTCGTSAEDRDESSDLIQQADVPPGETAVLRVVLRTDAPAFEPFHHLALFDATGEQFAYLPREISTSPDNPRRIYEQALGAFPQNGRVRVEARDEDERVLDFLTIEFSCHRTTPPAGE